MARQEMTYQLTGTAPLLLHNAQLADPLNPIKKRMAEITGKRKKTDADYVEIARLEFTAGLYTNGNGPCLPGLMVEAMLKNAAKREKMGQIAERGLACYGNFDIEYKGPRDVKEMWESGEYHLTVGARNQRARIMRTRPQFKEWAVNVTVVFDDTELNEKDLDRWFEVGGRSVGLADWRPRYGTFEAKRV